MTWANPKDADFDHVQVVINTKRVPKSPSDSVGASSNPPVGSVIAVYATGLGAVTPAVASGGAG